MIKAIETVYNGFRFRSRLEARWAVFFDALGIKYEYEKEGYDLGEWGYYLPDFWLPFTATYNSYSKWFPGGGRWVEIKGSHPSTEEIARCILLTEGTKHTSNLIVGAPGDQEIYWAHCSGNRGFSSKEDAENLLICLGIEFADKGHKEVRRAILTARQARFEHGENGRR